MEATHAAASGKRGQERSRRIFTVTTSEGLPCELVAEYVADAVNPYRITGSYLAHDSLDEYGRLLPVSFDVRRELDLPAVVFEGEWQWVGGSDE